MEVKLNLNGLDVVYYVQPGEYLLDSLRKNGVKSVKKGCNASACGACTVLVDEKPVLSCSVLTASIEGKKVMTVEAIQEEAGELADYFSKEGADQCGFCTSAIALAVHALRKENPHPTRQEIDDYLIGNLCRCTGLRSQGKAVEKYLGGKK